MIWERAEALQSWLDTIEKSRQAYIKILDGTMLENEELQSWLDRISEHWGDDEHPISTDLIRKTATGLRRLYYTYAAISLEAIAAYLDPQKPSEKPKNDLHFCDASRRWMDGDKADCTICSPKCEHSDDSGVFWEGNEADCPICNPKCETKGLHAQVLACERRCYVGGRWILLQDCRVCNPKHLCNDGIWEYIPKSECQRCNPKPKCEHKNLSGGTDCLKGKRCLDCGEWIGKPLTLCPECGGTRQKRVYISDWDVTVNYRDMGLWQANYVYERCPRCHGEGTIPK